MTTQFAETVAVNVQFGGVHWNVGGHFGVAAVRAFDDVRRPGLVVEAGAIVGAGHFAVASIEVTAMAQGKTVRFVGAQKVYGLGFDQRYECAITVVQQFAVDRFEVHDARILTRCHLEN